MRGLPFMPLDTVRLLDSDLFALSTGDEFKAATALWCKSWQQVPGGSLPDDERVLCHLSGSGSRWKRVRDMALRGWVKCSDGRLYHHVIAEKALEAWSHRKAQRARAAKRWENYGNATASPTAHADAHATAYPTAMQGTWTVKGQGIEKPQSLRDLSGEAPDAPQPGRNGHDTAPMRKLRSEAVQALLFLNEKTGRNYEPGPANVDPIVARLKEGSTLEDVRAVVAKKCREWRGDEKMEPYLRPKTLFNRTNFANYKGELGAPEPELRVAI